MKKEDGSIYKKVELEQIDKSGRALLNIRQMNQLLAKTPKDCIYTRAAKGGGAWDYVKGVYVKKVLNMIFGWDWDFEIVKSDIIGEAVVVMGRLTCRVGERSVVKMQFGRADIKYLTEIERDGKGNVVYTNKTYPNGARIPARVKTDKYLDIGNDMKAAATDALKKCASELGVASDVYSADDYKLVQVNEEVSDNGGEFLFMGTLFEDREQFLDAVRLELKKEVEKENELNELMSLHPHLRDDEEVMVLFEEKRGEILRG